MKIGEVSGNKRTGPHCKLSSNTYVGRYWRFCPIAIARNVWSFHFRYFSSWNIFSTTLYLTHMIGP